MKLNSINNNQQNFGMAIHSNEAVNKIIKNRIKNRTQLKELENIVEQAKHNNVVDIKLFPNPDSKTISAKIYSIGSINTDQHFSQTKSEGFLTKVFGGDIVKFIKKCSKIADKSAVKVMKAKDIAKSDVFDKMLK